MRIQVLLNEEAFPTTSISFGDLNTLQVRTLLRLADGSVDIDTASEKEYDIMSDLYDLGLLDQEYNLSERGQKAVAIAQKRGGSAEVQDAKRRQERLANFDRNNGSVGSNEVDDIEIQDGKALLSPDEGDDFEFELDDDDTLPPRF